MALSGFGVDDESIPTDTENRWDGQPRDSDGRFDKGSKSGKKFRISRKEKSSESPKKSDKGVEKSDKSGIIETKRMRSSSDYAVPKDLVSSRDFRSKFDSMDADKRIQREYYQAVKEMLAHRSGNNGEYCIIIQ